MKCCDMYPPPSHTTCILLLTWRKHKQGQEYEMLQQHVAWRVEKEEEEGLKAKAVSEVSAERDHATPAGEKEEEQECIQNATIVAPLLHVILHEVEKESERTCGGGAGEM